MPSIEAQYGLFLDPLFNALDCPNLVDGRDQPLHYVEYVDPKTDSLATLTVDMQRRQDKHHDQVDKGQTVHSNANPLHIDILDLFESFRVEFVMESQMLGVNERLPDPHREDHIVPALELKLVALMFRPFKRLLTERLHHLLIQSLVLFL